MDELSDHINQVRGIPIPNTARGMNAKESPSILHIVHIPICSTGNNFSSIDLGMNVDPTTVVLDSESSIIKDNLPG